MCCRYQGETGSIADTPHNAIYSPFRGHQQEVDHTEGLGKVSAHYITIQLSVDKINRCDALLL